MQDHNFIIKKESLESKKVLYKSNFIFKKSLKPNLSEKYKSNWNNLLHSKVSFGDKVTIAQEVIREINSVLNKDDNLKKQEILLADFLNKINLLYNELLEKDFHGVSKIEKMSPLILKINDFGKNLNNEEMIFYALAISLFNDRAISASSNFTKILELQLEKESKAIKELLKARISALISLVIKDLNESKNIIFNNSVQELLIRPINANITTIDDWNERYEVELENFRKINNRIKLILKEIDFLKQYDIQIKLDKNLNYVLSQMSVSKELEINDEFLTFLHLFQCLNYEISN